MTTDPSDIVEQLRLNERMRRELASETAGERRDYLLEEARLNAEAAAEITRLRELLRQAHGVIAHGPASGLAWKYTLDNIDDALNRPRFTECEKMLAKKLAGSSE